MRAVDQNGDGLINKYDLFICFKYLTAGPKTNGQLPPKMTGQQGPANTGQRTGANGQAPRMNNQMGGYGPMAGGLPMAPGMTGIIPICPVTYGAPIVGLGVGMPLLEFQPYGPMNIGFGMFDW